MHFGGAVSFRNVLFWCHLVIGITAGAVIMIMSVTGVLLTYEKQIIQWSNRSYRISPPANGAARLPLEQLLAQAETTLPDETVSSVTLRPDPQEPVEVGLSQRRSMFLNPYTAEALGEGSRGIREFFRVVTDWHRWLGLQGTRRDIGRAVTGACNFAFLFLVLSGLYLWIPRRWSVRSLRAVGWFNGKLRGKARDFNWHNVIGFWCALPLVIIVASGVVISYPWAGGLVYRLAGEEPPSAAAARNRTVPGERKPPRENRGKPGIPGARRSAPAFTGLSDVMELANQRSPGWRTLTIRLPASPEGPVVCALDHGTGGQPQKRVQLSVDRGTGAVVGQESFGDSSPGRRMRSLLRFAHTGEVAGVAGQSLAGIVSLGTAFMVWTGLALACRRLFGGRRR
jgi:uncharacterized iron-regulated membrane protein